MKVTIIHPRLYEIGGAEKLMVDLSIEFASKGYTVQVITLQCHDFWRERLSTYREKISIIETSPSTLSYPRTFWLRALDNAKKMSRVINRSSELIIASGFPSSISALITSKCKDSVVLTYLHDAPPVLHDNDAWKRLPLRLRLSYSLMSRIYGNIDKEYVKNSDVIATNSLFSAKVNARVYEIEQGRIKIIYPGINPREYTRLNNASCMVFLKEIKRKGKEIIFAPKGASLWRRPETLIAALTKVRNVFCIFTYDNESERRKVNALARKAGVSERVICLPKLVGVPLKKIYSESSIVISLSIRESFGLTPLESLMNGVPVIISKTSGVSEVLEDRIHALHSDPDDHEMLASQIEELLTNKQLREEIVCKGQERILKDFTIQRFAISLLKEAFT